jgi:hypothetical protein
VTDVGVEMLLNTVKHRLVTMPAEKALFPPWLSPIYSNLNIGRDYYYDILGVGSICDPIQFLSTRRDLGFDGLSYPPDSISAKDANSLTSQKLEDLKARSKGTLVDKYERVSDGSVETTTTMAKSDEIRAEIELGSTIQQSVDALVKAYADLSQNGYSKDAFIKSYAYRPVATMKQVLGSPEFDIATFADEYRRKLLEKGAKEQPGEVSKAIAKKQNGEGFHSRAFGPYSNLEFLPTQLLPRINGKGGLKTIDPRIDPRAGRYFAVKLYIESLKDKTLTR